MCVFLNGLIQVLIYRDYESLSPSHIKLQMFRNLPNNVVIFLDFSQSIKKDGARMSMEEERWELTYHISYQINEIDTYVEIILIMFLE